METEMIWKMLGLSAALVFFDTAAHASDVEGARQVFKRLDTNGDRLLQFSEIQAARAAAFDGLDADGDGFLSHAEARSATGALKAKSRIEAASMDADGSRLAGMDGDADGRISRGEFSAFIPLRLRVADANGDGSLSIRELRSMKRQ